MRIWKIQLLSTKMLLISRNCAEKTFRTIVYLGLDGDDYELELTYNYDHGPYVVGDGFAHIALSTPDLEALHAKHSKAGYEVTEPKGLPGNAPNYYFVKDPDGYKVEVIREKSL